jgi:hypothetical protein
VSVSSTKPAATSWKRKRSRVRSGTVPSVSGRECPLWQALLEPGEEQRLQRARP